MQIIWFIQGSKIQEIFKAIDLKYYNIIDLLNDHYHIQEFHKQNDEDFHYIFEQINFGNTTKGCRIDQCEMMKRNNLSKYSEYIGLFHGLKDKDDIICLQLFDKIHCSLYHCYDLYRFSPEQNQQLQAAVDKNRKSIHDQSQKKKNDTLLHQSYYKTVGQFMRIKNFNLKQIKGKENFNKLIKYSTFADDIKGDVIQELGIKYIYDENEQKQSDINRYIQPRWNNLKEELLNNKIFKLSNMDWELCVNKAERYYFVTNKLKQSQRKIDVESMLCLLFFVNFEKIQQRFLKTYFAKIMSEYHSDFCIFAGILSHAISTYGLSLQNYNFYHGLIINDKNKNIEFKDVYLKFNCPIITTSRFEVIHNYQHHKKGIILNMANCSDMIGGNARFIDTTWFADMECEEQQIFFAEANQQSILFRIASIVNLQNYSNYFYFLNGINILQCLITEKNIGFQLGEEMFISIQILIESIINPQSRIHLGGHDMIDMFKLFDSFCCKQYRIKINMDQIIKTCKNNKYLLNFFILQTSNKKISTLNIKNLMKLFKNMASLSIGCHNLDSTIFANILKFISNKNSKIEHIDFNHIAYNIDNKSSYHNIDEALKEHETKFESIGYLLEMDTLNNLIISKENYTFNLTDSCKFSIIIRDPRFTSMDYHNMHVNTYAEDVYEIRLKLDNGQQICVDKSYGDLQELNDFMTKKRKGVESLKFKSKLPSNSFKSGSGRNPFGMIGGGSSKYLNNNSDPIKKAQERKRQQQKVETYLQYLLKIVVKHKNQMFKKKLYAFISSNH